MGEVLRGPFDGKAQGRLEVLLIADHDVHKGSDGSVYLLGALLAADALPQGGAVVQVIGNDRAVLAGGLDGFQHHVARRFGKSRINAAGMEPAHAVPAEQGVPVHVAGLHLAGGAQSAVGTAHGGAHAIAAFREIQAHAAVAADAVKGGPFHVIQVQSALKHAVLQKPPYGIVADGGDDGAPHPETAPQPAGHVVFPAAFADTEGTRGMNAAFAGVQPQHHFAKGCNIPAALLLRFNR